MKRSKSGAQKRKEAATARDAVAKLPKMTDFFKITEQSRPGTSTDRDEENYSVQEKEDYDDQHQSDCEFPENVSCDLPANTQPSISKITESQFTPIPDDPCKWPESISDAPLYNYFNLILKNLGMFNVNSFCHLHSFFARCFYPIVEFFVLRKQKQNKLPTTTTI